MDIPFEFAPFSVSGYDIYTRSLRELYWLHYPGSGPKATLWDEWLVGPSLWPAVETDGYMDKMRAAWSEALSNRPIDSEGYVSTQQHASIAHPYGWPFPFWNQGQGGMGWHFSFKDTVGLPWRPDKLSTTDGWTLAGTDDDGIGEDGWNLKLTSAKASISTPKCSIDTFQSPFIQLRWRATGLDKTQPYIEWTTKKEPDFSSDKRFYFDPASPSPTAHTIIPVYKHPRWKGEVTQLHVSFGNTTPGASATIQALFTTYDTRHDINGSCYVKGCTDYFRWTRDIGFLRKNINRMRTALRYIMTEHKALDKKVVYCTWVGHDGRSGLKVENGKKEILSGHGIGDNYWDLLPFGNYDAYATILYYEAVRCMEEIERAVREHPEWNVPTGALAMDPDMLKKHAQAVKDTGNKLFWNQETGRFVPCINTDNQKPDYGLTFLNLEAIYYGFATPEHAESIMSWISGKRVVEGDTSKGADIYHWRFAPRATTKRNIDNYFWAWSGPETIPWGGQVQDGGAVLGFSYHDLMARLYTLGPDDAWKRLQEIVNWFDEVQKAGGYRKYYDGSREGTLQGGGTAGGLGLDSEFFESVLVPQVMIDGFLGFKPRSDGFYIYPNLPNDWPELTVRQIRYHDVVLDIMVDRNVISISKEGQTDEPCFVRLPEGNWTAEFSESIGNDYKHYTVKSLKRRKSDNAVEINWPKIHHVRFVRTE